MFTKWDKFFAAITGAAVLIVGRHFGETSWEYLDLTTIVTAAAVFFIPNKPAV